MRRSAKALVRDVHLRFVVFDVAVRIDIGFDILLDKCVMLLLARTDCTYLEQYHLCSRAVSQEIAVLVALAPLDMDAVLFDGARDEQ